MAFNSCYSGSPGIGDLPQNMFILHIFLCTSGRSVYPTIPLQLGEFELLPVKMPMKLQRFNKSQWSLNFELFILNLFQATTANTLRLKFRNSSIFIDKFNRTKKRPYILISIVLCLFTSIFSLQLYHIQFKWNDLVNFGGLMCACVVIVVEANRKNGAFIRFICVKRRIEQELRKIYGPKLYDAKKGVFLDKYWKMFVRYQIVLGFLEIFIMIFVYDLPVWILYCLGHALPMSFLRLRFFQHYFHVLTIHFYIQLIHEHVERYILAFDHLEELVEQQNGSFIEFDTQTMVFELRLIKHLFSLINDMANLINELFSFSMLSILMVNFLLFFINLLWMYVELNDRYLYCAIGELSCGISQC